MCNCVVEVTAKVASHLESQGVEIVGTPDMDSEQHHGAAWLAI
mgnify:FL=1